MRMDAMLVAILPLVIFGLTLVLTQEATAKIPDWDNMPKRKGKCYNTEVLLNEPFPISQIAVSYVTGNIYFINSIHRLKVLRKGETDSEEISIPMTHINTIAADNFVAVVYIGFTTGIKIYYEYSRIMEDVPDRTENTLELFMPKWIRTMYTLIATVHNSEQISKYVYEVYKSKKISFKGEKIPITVDRTFHTSFVIDKKGNYYFKKKNATGNPALHVLAKDSSLPTQYEFSDSLNHLAVNEQGKAYAASETSLCRLKPDLPHFILSLGFESTAMGFAPDNNLVFGSQQNNSLILMTLDKYCFGRGMLVRPNISIAT